MNGWLVWYGNITGCSNEHRSNDISNDLHDVENAEKDNKSDGMLIGKYFCFIRVKDSFDTVTLRKSGEEIPLTEMDAPGTHVELARATRQYVGGTSRTRRG